MDFSIGDVREIGRIEYDGEYLDSVEEIFERLYAPTREMAREHSEVYKRGREDSYRFSSKNSGRLKELEEQQCEELEKDISVEILLGQADEPVVYDIEQINHHEKRYMANAPSAVKLVSETGDSFVLHEAKDYEDTAEAFHFGEGEDVQRFSADGAGGYIPVQEFFEGMKETYEMLRDREGFSPLLPEVGLVEETAGYDGKTEHQMYFMRDFDDMVIEQSSFPDIDNMAAFAASLDLLGIERADADPEELLYSSDGFVYESDLEKMLLVEDMPVGENPARPGMKRMQNIFSRVHSGIDGSSLMIDGRRPTSDDILAAIESEYPEMDQDAIDIRRRFRDGISDWDSSHMPEPFVDLRN